MKARRLLAVIGSLVMLGLLGCSAPVKLRVMTYNIHHAEGIDGRVDLLRIAELIQRENPDLVALQEVDRNVLRTGGRDLIEELAALTKMHHAYGKNIDFQGGAYGNAVLSRFPILRKENHHLPMVGQGEQRGLLETMVKIGAQEVVFISTHLDHRPDEAERVLALGVLEKVLSKVDRRSAIVSGDFNARTNSAVYAQMNKMLKDVWPQAGQGAGFTIAAGRPYDRIDFIFVGESFKPVRAWVPETPASDHLPVVVDLHLSP